MGNTGLTSHDRKQDTIEGLEAGADDYVTKPFEPGELVMRVNTGRRIIAAESSGMTIFALAKLAESRDPETGAHLERVRSYCRALAQQLHRAAVFPREINDEYVRLIYETSPLHDIGKVGRIVSGKIVAGRIGEGYAHGDSLGTVAILSRLLIT